MSLQEWVEGDPLKFKLVDRSPGADLKMIVLANSEENKDTWIRQLRCIFDMQGDFLRGKFRILQSCHIDYFIDLTFSIFLILSIMFK